MRNTNRRTRTADANTPATATVPAASGTPTNPPTALHYLQAVHVLAEFPVSRRTLSNWQRRHVVPFHKIGRTVLFKRGDIEAALGRFRVKAVGE